MCIRDRLGTDRGAQQDRIVGGSVRIAETMAAELGDRVLLGAPVRRIEQHGEGIRVETRHGDVLEGARVIVTLPPTLAGRLEFAPVLPSWRDQLTQRLPAGSVVKLYCVCLLYTSDAADERSSVDLGGRRIITTNKRTKV